MLGELSGLADIAAHGRDPFPPPGPDLPGRLRDVPGVLELSAGDVRVERRWSDAGRRAPGHYTGAFFDVSHQFDRSMQNAAFAWLTETVADNYPMLGLMKESQVH